MSNSSHKTGIEMPSRLNLWTDAHKYISNPWTYIWGKNKVKLSLYLIKYYAIKTYGEVKV
jgi:hypothetical protein